jgi:2-amino-4-hydroxy-6-hydroxymethyldihydropteridine diphosphokinase
VILVDARPVPAYVALGANLGDARRTVRQAVQDLGRLPQTRLVRVSSLYRTAPVDSSGPDYINAVAEVATSLTPHALLAELQRLELAAGRERPYLNAPRTLDLDILLYDDLTLDSPTLTIPHPRMATRAFVLVPLAEIAPQLLGAEQLEAVRGQVIERLPED